MYRYVKSMMISTSIVLGEGMIIIKRGEILTKEIASIIRLSRINNLRDVKILINYLKQIT